jgi:hypothetical protein
MRVSRTVTENLGIYSVAPERSGRIVANEVINLQGQST